MFKNFIWLSSFLFCSPFAIGQISEVGFGIGGLTYTGDLQRGYNFTHNRPAATIFFRSNINPEISLRSSITFGKLKDSDENPFDPLAVQRQASFNVAIFEGSLVFEYHFLDFKKNPYLRFSPYIFGGFGIFGFTGEGERTAEFSNIQLAIPFGAGIKYILNPIWVIALEFGPRLTFFDYIDNISEGNPSFKNFQHGNKNDNDKYYYLGLTLSYSFYKIPCPYPTN